MHVRSHEYFIPTEFHKHLLSGSVVTADFVFPYNTLVHPPNFQHLNKYIKKFIKILKAFKSLI